MGRARGEPRAIDWETAQRVGELIAGSPPFGGASTGATQELAHDFAARVRAYTGLRGRGELPPLELVDRPGWIAANLASMRPLVGPLAERLADDWEGLLAGPARAGTAHLLGAQLGALAGMLSQRVLGQYEVSLLGESTPPRVLMLAPNLAAAARNLGVERRDLDAWVAIHEITHAVQFDGVPWLREYLGGMLAELLAALRPDRGGGDASQAGGAGEDGAKPAGAGDGRAGLEGPPGARGPGDARGGPGLGDLRALLERARAGELELRTLIARARRGELLRLGLGEERWALVERMQATMSLVEGHAEHTMDAVGAEVLPSLPRLRAAMTRRRASRGLPWRVLERLLGLELKLRQYEVGRRFCDAVVAAEGPAALTVAWRSPRELPTQAELDEPAAWLARVQIPA